MHAFARLALLFLLGLACTRAPVEPLRVGTNVWPGYELLYLARELGYLDPSQVHIVEYGSATEVIRAWRNGAIQAGMLTLDEVLLLEESGTPTRVVLVTDISKGGDVVLGQKSIRRLDSLKGLRVGVESTALGAVVLTRALESVGLSVEDVIPVPLEVDEHEAAFREGRVDAVVTFEPVRGRLLAMGATLLFDSSQMPGEIVDVLAVHRSWIERHPEQVSHLVDAWFRAYEYLQENRADAVRRMAVRERVSPEMFEQSLSGIHIPSRAENLKLLEGESARLLETSRRLALLMHERGLLAHPVALDESIDGTVVKGGGP